MQGSSTSWLTAAQLPLTLSPFRSLNLNALPPYTRTHKQGNGESDKPSLAAGRSAHWTIDTHVEVDVPALLRFVLRAAGSSGGGAGAGGGAAGAPRAHFIGHSMGGMVLCGVMARGDATAAKVRSCAAVASGLFLGDSWWRLFERLLPLSRALRAVPSGALLRAYAPLMLGAWRVPFLDMLYLYPPNVDRRLARALMTRNFSDISPGVIRQIASAFAPEGLATADGRARYAGAGRLGRVGAPALFLVGDYDRMCPPAGVVRFVFVCACVCVSFGEGRFALLFFGGLLA